MYFFKDSHYAGRLYTWTYLGAGPSIKYVTLKGEGVREGMTVCDRGRWLKRIWRHTYKFFYHTYETWNLKWCLTLYCNRCILTEGGKDKNHPGQNLPDKRPLTKPPGQKLPQTIEREFVQGAFVWVFCTRPTKNRGSEVCNVLFGGSRDVWQSVTEGGGQNWPKIALCTLWTAP